jgi:hypothetical protein
MHGVPTQMSGVAVPLDGCPNSRAREADRLTQARARRQPGNPLDGRQRCPTQDPAGNLKPAKDKSTDRIDGNVAAIMAIGHAMVAQEEPYVSYQLFWV